MPGPLDLPARRSLGGEFLESVAVALILAILIRLFVLQPFYIPSGSMEPTLMPGDRIVVGKADLFGQPKPGEVVVFHYPLDPRQDFVKRLIAVGGQTVQLRNSNLYINGKLVPEPYLPPGLTFADFGPVTVPAGTYFMLGDNRNNSDDSRVWGYVKKNLVVGRVLFIYWPLSRIGVVR
ncbi:MAG: signal peptidase I [Peptococcaceae bacterium]|jgi:signal peptidase I|nr:signal peptidase I [Peptococcaceae bacterium]